MGGDGLQLEHRCHRRQQRRLRIEGAMSYSPDVIVSYAIAGSQIAIFAALGLVLTAIMLRSACHVLRTLPRGHVRWSATALAVLAFEAPFLWLARVEPDVSLGEFAGAIVLGVIGFMLVTCCALALKTLRWPAELAGRPDGAEKAHSRQPAGRFTTPRRNEWPPDHNSPEGDKPISGSDLARALGELIVQLLFLV
jgi:hypothetical protein